MDRVAGDPPRRTPRWLLCRRQRRSACPISSQVGGNRLRFRRLGFVFKFHRKRCVWSFSWAGALFRRLCRAAKIRPFNLVVNNFGKLGTALAETDVGEADLETTINDLMSGQYSDPVRVVAFNTAEHWAEDASEDVAREILRRLDLAGQELPSSIEAFIERHIGHDRQLSLRLA
jgi:hypothetical protein